MKKNIYKILLTVVSLIVTGCSNAEDKTPPIILQTTDKYILSPQTQPLQTPQSELNCA